MQLGTAKLTITPPMPVRLCGYATRTTSFEQVKEDIFVRVQLHRCGQEQLLFVYGDLLWWGTDFVAQAREKISANHGIAQEQIFFVASHNHSGPPTSDLFTPSLETFSPAYAQFLQERVLEAVALAQKDMEPVQAFRHDGSAAFNVFRRVLENGTIQMKPNYEVPADQALTLIALRREDGSLKGTMIHYPCHANISNENAVQPDYPGVALRILDDAFSGSVSIFLQGCTADLRPNSVLGQRFVPAGYEKVLVFAEDFANICLNLLNQKGQTIIPQFSVRKQLLELPLDGVLSSQELEARARTAQGVEQEWAQTVQKKHNNSSEQLELSKIEYGDRLNFFTFSAEVSQYYAAYARSVDPHAVCVAYANGMIGYLCTSEQVVQGGYEPIGSALYFALPGTYSPKLETIIHAAIASAAQSE